MSNAEVTGLDWSAQRLVPAFQAPQHLDVYDIRHASPDVQLAVTTMAGIVNRPQPQVYLLVGDDDVFWLRQVLSSIPQTMSSVANDDTLEAILTAHRSSIQGLIIYDPDLPDTVNVATTLAGQRDGIVVSPTQAQDLAPYARESATGLADAPRPPAPPNWVGVTPAEEISGRRHEQRLDELARP